MNIEYRRPTKEEWPLFGKAVSRGFGNHPPTDDRSVERWEMFRQALSPVGAWDGDQVVGTSGSFVSETTIPGGAKLQAALVTIVTVAATHRRRGILTNMMRRLLEEAHERGEPISTLWASESIIYGRFGFGMAGQHHDSTIMSEKGVFTHLPEMSGSVHYADRARIREIGPDVWTRTAAVHPGMPQRSPGMWQGDMPLPEAESKPEDRRFYGVYEENGKAEGYVSYQTIDKQFGMGESDLHIKEFIAATDVAHAALWRFILSIDLIEEVKFGTMQVDDPLWWMLSDPRQLKRVPYDAIWLRLLDVERALSARMYSKPIDVVFSVDDEFCPWVEGNYRLTADPSGKAECRKTEDTPDIVLPAASLATCYFGSVKFSDLARAGRAVEKTAGALLQADRAFAAEREPWCPLHY